MTEMIVAFLMWFHNYLQGPFGGLSTKCAKVAERSLSSHGAIHVADDADMETIEEPVFVVVHSNERCLQSRLPLVIYGIKLFVAHRRKMDTKLGPGSGWC